MRPLRCDSIAAEPTPSRETCKPVLYATYFSSTTLVLNGDLKIYPKGVNELRPGGNRRALSFAVEYRRAHDFVKQARE